MRTLFPPNVLLAEKLTLRTCGFWNCPTRMMLFPEYIMLFGEKGQIHHKKTAEKK
jgi:hypothetical protein